MLNHQLVSIYEGDRMIKLVPAPPVGHPTHVQEFLKPIDSGIANKVRLMRNGSPPANLAAVQELNVNRLPTIIAQSKAGNGANSEALFRAAAVINHVTQRVNARRGPQRDIAGAYDFAS